MKEIEQIEHEGLVQKIVDNELKINILSKSACVSCKIKGACNVSDMEEKNVDAHVDDPENYKIGDRVDIYYKQSLGFRAMFLGYLLPFLIMFFVLIVSLAITQKEAFSGLLSLFSLIPYYATLYLTRDKHKKTFSFSVKKKNISYKGLQFS